MGHCNKSVIVTAGANGIGHAIATRFFDQGAKVQIVDIDADAVAQFSQKYPDIKASIEDVASEQSVNGVVEKQLDWAGGIDVMVNCAGIAGPTAAVEDISVQDWHRCLAVNLDSTFLFCAKVVPHMKKRGSGNIINISSTAGWHGYPLRSPYASAKWAVIGFTKSLAMELGQCGIRANAICPGSIDGDRMDRVIAAEARLKDVSEQQIRDSYTKGCSMRTFIDPEDIADMALFLSSDAASKVTGQIMNVDGHLESFGGLD